MRDQLACSRETDDLGGDVTALGKLDVEVAPPNIDRCHLSPELAGRGSCKTHIAVKSLADLPRLDGADQRLGLRCERLRQEREARKQQAGNLRHGLVGAGGKACGFFSIICCTSC